MKPYPFYVSQSRQQKHFNYALFKSRRVVENAFGHLKARSRRIGNGIDNSFKNASAIIWSCCVLHNFLNENNDAINENWMQALQTAEANRTYPQHIASLTELSNNPEGIRNAIATFLSDDGGAGDDNSSVIPGVATNDCGVIGDAVGIDGDGSGEVTGVYGDGSGEAIDIDGDGSDEVVIDDGCDTMFEFMSLKKKYLYYSEFY
ncbi:uncharacterized protein LOC118736605 [Rhagoletis pomonella]|uniref:uncharacterized protein LOC118736605 n=1 Tax=Rhagoletis pomonella TaxID=28610 RepID=UPI00178280CE|nr:uncharacterized protein LOC118736605 [Rhagoletis pomonella]